MQKQERGSREESAEKIIAELSKQAESLPVEGDCDGSTRLDEWQEDS